nr:immunoglobulin light chain junction region [Macaca mulatta]
DYYCQVSDSSFVLF